MNGVGLLTIERLLAQSAGRAPASLQALAARALAIALVRAKLDIRVAGQLLELADLSLERLDRPVEGLDRLPETLVPGAQLKDRLLLRGVRRPQFLDQPKLGHKRLATTVIYAYLDDNALQAAAERAAGVIAKTMGYTEKPHSAFEEIAGWTSRGAASTISV